MRVISKKTLRLFWEAYPAAEPPLRAWYKVTLAASWQNFAELRQTFNTADHVGDCVVFDIGGNKYRLIGRVRYTKDKIPGVVYVLTVMTHAEYDENKWPDECGCHNPPPKKLKKRKPAGGHQPTRGKRKKK